MIQAIKNLYNDMMRPIRNFFLKRYLNQPVIVFKGNPTKQEGGIYIVRDWNGLDNTLQVFAAGDEDSEYEFPLFVKTYDVQVYSMDKSNFFGLTFLNLVSTFIGRL